MNVFELFGTISLKDDGFSNKLKDATEHGRSFASNVGKAFLDFGKVAAVGLGSAAVAMAGLTSKALNLTGELEQNLGGSEAVFNQFSDTVKQKGKEAFATMGLAQSEYLATANKMGALMQGSGISVEKSMDMTTKAMQRASDVASIMGISNEEAMASLTSMSKGNLAMADNLGKNDNCPIEMN